MLRRLVDRAGTGRLTRDAAVKGLRALGLKRSAANDRIARLARGRYARRKGGVPVLVLTGIDPLLASCLPRICGTRVALSVQALMGRAYRQALGTAAIAAFDGRPISRAAKVDLCGVSASTQRRGERNFGAEVIPHYVVHELHRHADPCNQPCGDGGGRVFGRGNEIIERRPSAVNCPFPVSRAPRRRHSATPMATAEPTSSRPTRQTFETERTVRGHVQRHGSRPRPGWRFVNPDDPRLFARDGERRLFGQTVLFSRCVG